MISTDCIKHCNVLTAGFDIFKWRNIQGIFEFVEQVIRYNLVWVSLRLVNHKAVYGKRKLAQARLCDYFMWLFEYVVGEWTRWWRHNTNPGYQNCLQAD